MHKSQQSLSALFGLVPQKISHPKVDNQSVNKLFFSVNHTVMNNVLNTSMQTAGVCGVLIGLLLLGSSLQLEAAEAKQVAMLKPYMDLSKIETKASDFLKSQTLGYPGNVNITILPLDKQLKLAQCPDMDALMPNGSRPWGKTAVAIKCRSLDNASKWTLYVQANVAVLTDYVVSVEPLSQGQMINANQVMLQNGDITQLPSGVFTQLSQVIGSAAKMSLTAGTVIRQDVIKLPLLVRQGQSVTLSSIGNGFQITAQGQAMNNAELNQIVQVKMASGKLVSGIANAQGLVEVTAQ